MKIVQATGQTCNQLWIYSNFIADAIENNEKFAIWVPDPEFIHYSNLLNSRFIYFPLSSKLLINLFGFEKYVKFLSRLLLNKYCLYIVRIIFVFIPSIDFKIVGTETNVPNINRQKHINKIKHIFQPNIETKNFIDKQFSELKQHYDLIIGIHIRYGDYRTYKNGLYFFELEEYKYFLRNISKIFINKKIAFFIASNEDIIKDCFSEFKHFSSIECSPLNDLIGLSKCDYICGPPSTFSAWASFYGHVPLYFIENINQFIARDSFINIEDVWL